MISADDGWIAGFGGTTLRWNGMQWNNVTNPDGSLRSVFMVNADDGWIVGDGGSIIHWNGTTWNITTSPTYSTLNSVFMVNAEDGWAVGNGGTIMRWTGTRWIPEFPSFLILPIFMIATLLAVIVYKRKHAI
jgi:photosystem II stability/assembly factor-like uncharacterized protein